MAARGDQRVSAAVVAILQRGPRDVVDLLEALRRVIPGLLAGHEGSLHPLLHALRRRGVIRLASLSSRGLVCYALGEEGAPRPDEAPAPPSSGEASRVAVRIASVVRGEAARARIVADVTAHLAVLGDAGDTATFGARRTVRHDLKRADRGRPSVFFSAGGGDRFRRFVLHEGPWILGAVLVFLLVRAFFAEVFVIPSGSMVPTLLPGDRVVVWKPGGASMPERWQILTFERAGSTYVKRAVGLGGEEIALVGGDVYLDGRIEAKPDDVRMALRLPYQGWDFASAEDQDDWARVEERPGEVLWTYAGRPLRSAGVLHSRTVGTDVRLRDVYADLLFERAVGEEVVLELAYVPTGAGPDETALLVYALSSGDGETALCAYENGLEAVPFAPVEGEGGSAAPGRLRLRLSHVDGVIRAEGAGSCWRAAAAVPVGWRVIPRIRVRGPASRLLRLTLDKDIHYSRAGRLGVPSIRSDDDPMSYAYRIPDDHVFFLGDNTYDSRDSRYPTDPSSGCLGPVAVDELTGPVVFRIWPPKRLGGVR